MSTHPDPGDRYNSVNQDADKWKEKLDFASWKVNEDSYLHLIDGMVYGEDPRQGFVEDNVFYHPELKFKFPYASGWQFENSPLQVRMAPKDGKALMIFTFAPQKSLEEAVQTTLQGLKVNVLDSKSIAVNGMPAVVTISNQVSQDQSTGQESTIKIMSCFIDKQGTYYVFHGVSSEADFNNYTRSFESTMMNFDKLTDPARLNKQPKRISIKKVQRSGSLADALRSFGVPQQNMEEFAFLNNLELTDQVPVGKLLKIAVD